MSVLVIGATGLTGATAVRQVLERGDVVTAFGRHGLVDRPGRIEERHDGRGRRPRHHGAVPRAPRKAANARRPL